jgi:glycosyltransferase involved in cell wall biosynthesis
MDPFITFIIPTIGRTTLLRTVDSLLKQIDADWNAIIIFDGIKNSFEINDKRIKIIEIEKTGIEDKKNNGGMVRNIGFKYINKNSKWIGFVDDDDTISNDYIICLKKELEISINVEVVIFRMKYENGCILPSKFDRNIIYGKVGISFAVSNRILENENYILFENHPMEDYLCLKKLQNKGYFIVISSFVTYFIRHFLDKYDLDKNYMKILFNNKIIN